MTPHPTRLPALALVLTLAAGCAYGSLPDGPDLRPTHESPGTSSLTSGDAGPPGPGDPWDEDDAGGPLPDDPADEDAGPPPTPPPPAMDAGRPAMDADPPACVPAPETCNGGDDDCDGRIDEGAADCPCEGVVLGDHSYLFCAARRSWPGARLHCELHGYELARVEDATEDTFLYAAILSRGFADTWLGHNDLLVEGAWMWRDGLPMTYTHWDEGEPNDGGEGGRGEDCGILMTTAGREARWDDRPCDSERPYICEAEPRP